MKHPAAVEWECRQQDVQQEKQPAPPEQPSGQNHAQLSRGVIAPVQLVKHHGAAFVHAIRVPAVRRRQRVPRQPDVKTRQPAKEEAGDHTDDDVDGGPGGRGDEIRPRRVRNIHEGQSAQRPHQHFLSIAVHRSSTKAMPELVQQHDHEQQSHQHGGVDPATRDDVFLVGDAQDEACGHEWKHHVHPDRDAEETAQRKCPAEWILHLLNPTMGFHVKDEGGAMNDERRWRRTFPSSFIVFRAPS